MLIDAATDPIAALLLAHGAGAPMDSAFMNALSTALSSRGITILRFEFPYMATRRTGANRRPPPRAERLCDDYRTAVGLARAHAKVNAAGTGLPLLIGGKSLGGRVASLIANTTHAEAGIAGLVCLGYPFHPQAKPDRLRTAHLADLTCPTLICQGTRDPLGNAREIAGYALSEAIEFAWLTDGDHDFKPRKASGATQDANITAAADAIRLFAARVAPI